MIYRKLPWWLPLLAWLAVPSLLAAEARVLGPDGMILRLQSGAYGDLFPEGGETGANSSVLALDVLGAEGHGARFLVPKTENFAGESAASLIFEDATGTAYLLWEGLHNGFHPKLYLTRFVVTPAGGDWSEVIEITGSPYARKGLPQMVVTREPDGGGRLMLHVAWSEESGSTNLKRYAPILIENGEHPTRPPVWSLSSFLGDPEGAFNEISDALRLVPGSRDNTVVVAWMTENGERVASAEIELVHQALAELADKARAQIINSGARGRSKSRAILAEEIYQLVLASSGGFHQASLRHIAETVRAIVLAFPHTITGETAPDLGDKARAQIINSGLRFKSGALLAPEDFELVEVARPEREREPHLLKVRILSDRPTPEIGADPVLYAAPRGGDVIIAWDGEDRVYYVESQGTDWCEPQAIALSEDLDRAAAHEMLAARAGDR